MRLTYIFLFIFGLSYSNLRNSSYVQSPYRSEDNNNPGSLTDNRQQSTITTVPLTWKVSWPYSLEGLIIGILISLMAFYRSFHNKQLLSHERLDLVLNFIRRTQTPLSLIQNLLEEIDFNELSEPASNNIKKVMQYTNHVINYHQNAITLDKKEINRYYNFTNHEFELYNFINSIVNQCQLHANNRQIELKVGKNFNYMKCVINEVALSAALECLLHKVIDAAPCKSHVEIIISHSTDFWHLQITNCIENQENRIKRLALFSIPLPVYCCGSLRAIRKIIHIHGGKINGFKHGKTVCFRISIPIFLENSPVINKESQLNEDSILNPVQIRQEKQDYLIEDFDKTPHILLVMADKEYSIFLQKSLSTFAKVTLLEEAEHAYSFCCEQNIDAIIVDEIINGIYGWKVCKQIKSNGEISNIPIILLLNNNNNETYLTQIQCEADRIESRTVNICRLKADVQVLVRKRIVLQNKARELLSGNTTPRLTKDAMKDEKNILFMNKVQKLLEDNLASEKYNIDTLGLDMGMSRTSFYTKIRNITGKAPIDYVYAYKMGRAKALLLSGEYNITEISTMLGYCDAKHFGKRFKEFYDISPTRYIKNTKG